MDIRQFEDRKSDHLRHALAPAHDAVGLGGLNSVRLRHEALPEIDFEEIRLDAPCLGVPMATPFYVAGMTAGHAAAAEINLTLARACAERGWAMGVGSQRRELEAPTGHIEGWRRLHDQAPGVILFANIGLSQIAEKDLDIDRLRKLIEGLGAQALVVHANALQECLQPEGTPRFRGALDALKRICANLGAPVVLKETGCGFAPRTLARLCEVGLAAIDVSGLGGTHWGRIEGARAGESGDPVRAEAAQVFADSGEPTVDSVLAATNALPKLELWASGGVRSGLDAAKLLALGAHRIGYARPALEAALEGSNALDQWMKQREFELLVALFCTGSRTPADLRAKEGVWTRNTAN